MALLEGIAALLAKVASASTVAQATAGLGIAVAGVTGAGAAGVLPGPVQDTVAGAVEAVTPFELPRADDQPSVERHTAADDRGDRDPAVVPTIAVAVPVTVAPTPENETETETETEHGPETADSTHEHRGGRTAAPGATVDSSNDAPEAVEPPEVEDHHGGDDSSGHEGGGDSGGDSGHDDSSGHGGD